MEYKKTIILLGLVVFLLSITCVSASEIDNSVTSDDSNSIELSADNDIVEDNLQTIEENADLTLTDNDRTLSVKIDTNVLGDDSATYSGLAEEISESGNITLKYKSYIYDDDGASAITISEANKVIDGNGAVIDMAGSTIRAFTVSASDVTIKNLTIKNANYNGNGGAIYFRSSGTVTNCNFTDNSVTYAGGAVHFYDEGTVKNCNFTNNQATGDSSWGGAIMFAGTGNVTNCNFTDNHANYDGGAVYFLSEGTVKNCNFTDNQATYDGGAIGFLLVVLKIVILLTTLLLNGAVLLG